MKTHQLIDDVRELNLSYLLLAQQMIREDRAEALYRLGISDAVAELLGALSMAQIMKISASQNMLMCRFRFDDDVVWNLLTNHSIQPAVSGLHAAIVMAGKVEEVV